MILQISNFNLWFRQYDHKNSLVENHILKDISIDVPMGKTVALVGESGSGKSVTALSILRLLDHNGPSMKTSGSIRFFEEDLLTQNIDHIQEIRGNDIAMIFQEPMTSLNPVFPIGDQVMESLILHKKYNKKRAHEEAIHLLHRAGIDKPAQRLSSFPHQLSGGQRQRVMIAMALGCHPNLLIADEPTTALDVTIQAQILELLTDIQQEFGMSIILITHDLDIVRKHAHYAYIMKQGEIIEEGSSHAIFTKPQDKYTKSLVNALPRKKTETKKNDIVLIKTDKLTCNFSLKRSLQELFTNKQKVFTAAKNICLEFTEGTTVGIVGESGSGKSTLGQAILKLVSSNGQIYFDNQNIQTMKRKEIRKLRSDLQIVFQDPFSSLSPRLTVYEIIEEGLKIHKPELSKQECYSRILSVLEEVGLNKEMAYRFPHEFSGGQRQRIAIARALVLHPRFLILDEPTSALDVTIQGQVLSLLLDLQQKYNLTYMFISHDLKVIRSVSDYIAVMKDGEIIEKGPAEEVFQNPQQEYTKTLLEAAF